MFGRRRKEEAHEVLPVTIRQFDPEEEVRRFHETCRVQAQTRSAADQRLKDLEDARWAGRR